jgi:Dolichyl-phosphate-mannose-protein mannosyltransferase
LDVQRITSPNRLWLLGLGATLVLGLALRLAGIHNPILDHPGWRQGDTAAIARNFATLDLNIFHPQTDYDGPPPNYVELELQILPFMAAMLYKIFGIHEVFGRLISIGFSLGTIAVLAYFARWMFASRVAGFVAALSFAVYPGAFYYGRTFTPDTTMTFFLTAAVFASARWIVDDEARFGRKFWIAAALTATALLAKPVAIVGLVPIAAVLIAKRGWSGALRAPQTYVFFALALAPYLAYDAYVRTIAEWHWASGITKLHVLPALSAAFTSLAGFEAKFGAFHHALGMLADTMIGRAGFGLLVIACILTVWTRQRSQSNALLWAWLIAGLVYAYVVVTVERVDYYLYPLVPLAALWTGGLASVLWRNVPARSRPVLVGAGVVVAAAALWAGMRAVAPYYAYSKTVYRDAKALDATLPPQALVVMGHYDPSVLYYINRKGWEEDAYLWTPFDEESAIAKGARTFVAVEPRRLERNVELYAWLQRFPIANPDARWPVYETDPAKILPGADARWKAFRHAEKAHHPISP